MYWWINPENPTRWERFWARVQLACLIFAWGSLGFIAVAILVAAIVSG